MRLLILIPVLAVVAGPAFAQAPSLALPMGGEKTLTPEEREEQQARDRAYKESLKKIPNQAATNDPWGSARAAEQGQKAAPKAKSSSQK